MGVLPGASFERILAERFLADHGSSEQSGGLSDYVNQAIPKRPAWNTPQRAWITEYSEDRGLAQDRRLGMVRTDAQLLLLRGVYPESLSQQRGHRAAMVAFCNWCVSEGRLAAHPLAGLPKAEEAESARKRRPLTEGEIARLLEAAQERPLRDALTIRRGKNKGKPLAKVSAPERRRLRRVAQQRALVYKFMMLTGLRRSEASSVTVGALCLDEDNPYVHVEGKHAKSGCAATLPLRGDLADDLRRHTAHLAGTNDGEAPLDTPLFDIDWRNLLRTFNLDLAAAGIPKTDAQGRTVDVHSLRHTFATRLARNGISPGVAQKLMRHSDIRLTMNTYTHLGLADTASAVASLPRF